MTKKTSPSKEIIQSQLVWLAYEIIPVIVTKTRSIERVSRVTQGFIVKNDIEWPRQRCPSLWAFGLNY